MRRPVRARLSGLAEEAGGCVDLEPSVPLSSVGVCRPPFPPEVITLAVEWYLRHGLPTARVEELLGERADSA